LLPPDAISDRMMSAPGPLHQPGKLSWGCERMIGRFVEPRPRLFRRRDRMAIPPTSEEFLFWGAAIAIFIFAGGVMIYTSHFH
jgi:hypothetical protein